MVMTSVTVKTSHRIVKEDESGKDDYHEQIMIIMIVVMVMIIMKIIIKIIIMIIIVQVNLDMTDHCMTDVCI